MTAPRDTGAVESSWQVVYRMAGAKKWLAYLDAVKAQRHMKRVWDEVEKAYPAC